MAARELSDAEVFGSPSKELSDADVFGAPSAEAFVGAAPAPRPAFRMAGRGTAPTRAPERIESVLQQPGSVEPFAGAPDPRKNAEALFNALSTNPDLIRSPMYAPGAAMLQDEVTGTRNPVQSAMDRNRRDQMARQRREREVAQARASTDEAFGESPVVQAIAAPGRRLASGVASVVGGVAGIPQLFGSDIGKETADAASLMSRAHMPEDPSIADEVLAGVGQVGPMIGGAAAVRAALIPLFGEAAATSLATAASGAAGGAMTGGEVLRDLEFRGDLTDEQKRQRAGLAALFSTVTGKYADRFLLPGADKAASGVLQAGGRAFVAEGAQEGLDQMGQNVATDKSLGEGVGRAALVGGIVGGGSRAATETGSDATQLANAINADANALVNTPTPRAVWAPTEPQAAAQPPRAVQPAREMSDADVGLSAATAPSAAEFLDGGATQPAAAPAPAITAESASEVKAEQPAAAAAPALTPELQQQLVDKGWTPPKDTNASITEEGAGAPAPAPADAGAAPSRAPVAADARSDGADGQDGARASQPDAALNPNAQPGDVLGDFERLYQQDVKDSIRERLGMAKPQEQADAPRNTGFLRFLREHGVSSELAQDIYGDHAGRANRALPGVFRKAGMQMDDLVVRAVESGFLTQTDVESALDNGGTNRLVELIQDQIRGKAPVSTEMAGDVAAQQMAGRASAELDQQARAIGFDRSGMDDAKVAASLKRIERRRAKAGEKFDAREEARLERQAVDDVDAFSDDQLAALDAAWLGDENVTLADAMMALGFDPAEIDTYAAREAENRGRAQARDGDAGGAEARAGAADEGSQGRPALESYSPDEVVGRQDRAAQADRDEQRQQKEADQRAEADRQRDGFALTGSDRPADEAAARGQNNLQFRGPQPGQQQTSTADTMRTELRERFGTLADRLEKRGILKLWDSIDAYNSDQGQASKLSDDFRGVQGLYSHGTGVAHLFGDGVEPGKAVGVFLHEVGEHASMKAMLGERYSDLVRRAYRLVSDGDEIAETAMARIPDDTPAKFQDSELLAYMIEETANRENASPAARSWLREVIAAMRAWFFQTGFAKKLEAYGVKVEMTPKDIAALAVRAAEWQAQQESKPATSTSVDIELSRKAPVSPTGGQPAQNLGAQPWTVAEPGTWDNVVRQMQNAKVDLKRVRDAIEQQFGRLPDAKDSYLQEELYHGKVAARVERLHADYVEPILRKIAVAGKNSGVTLDDVNAYLHARHAPERNAAMAAINPKMANNTALSGMSDAEAAKVLSDFRTAGKTPALAMIAKDVDQLLADTRTAIVADGLEEASVIQAWEAAYKHYVPLQRDVDGKPAKGSGFSVKGPEAKRATGSNKAAVNILANVVTQAETAAIRAEKAEVGRSLLEMAQSFPNSDFWKVDTPPTKPRVNPATGLVERTAVDPNFQAADNVVMVKDYGATRFIVFNKDSERAMQVAKAMKNLDIAQVPKVVQYVGKGTRFMASLLTQRNPEFWFTNLARDLQGSAIQMNGTDAEGLQAKVAGYLPKAMAGMRHVARGTGVQSQWARHAQDLKDAGGTTGYMEVFGDSNERMKSLEKEVDRMNQGKADPRRLVRSMLEFVDDYNDVIENGMRLAVFQAAREAGISTQRAASIAKNITVNFNRKGNLSPLVNSLYMFFNAGIQGTARMSAALATSNKARVVVGGLAGLAFVMDVVNRAMAGDDDETKRNRYDLINEFEKSRNWIFMNPAKPGSYVKVPLPLGFHIFHNAGRLMADAIFRKDPRNAAEYGWAFTSTLLDAFNPMGNVASVGQLLSPSVLRPAVQLAENKNFMGGKVYRDEDQGFGKTDPRPAYQRFFETTPDFWKQASKGLNDITGGDKIKPGAVNIEPDILRHVWAAMTGGPGRALDKTADTVQAKGRGEEITPARIPFAHRFVGEVGERQKDSAYFEDLKRAGKAKDQFDYFVKHGRREQAIEVLRELGGGDVARGRRVIAEYQLAKKDERAINRRLRQLREAEGDEQALSDQQQALKERRSKNRHRVLSNTAKEQDGDE